VEKEAHNLKVLWEHHTPYPFNITIKIKYDTNIKSHIIKKRKSPLAKA
jgi:hypothetical protein